MCTGLSSAQVAQFLQTENGFREDSFAHPGFGLTMAPGMACGAPVIASEYGRTRSLRGRDRRIYGSDP